MNFDKKRGLPMTFRKKRMFGMISVFVLLFSVNIVFAEGLDTGDIAWVSVSAVLVMLMTPALGFFYAGLVRKKNLLSTLVQCLAIFAIVSLVWALWAYSLVFSKSIGGFIGDLSFFGLNGVGIESVAYAATIPALLFMFFQLQFAAITPALIIGAFAERIRFSSLILFIILWTTFVCAPIAHWVWNSVGWLHNLGAIDFAGGLVVHISAGLSALRAALVRLVRLQRRKRIGREWHCSYSISHDKPCCFCSSSELDDC